MTLPDRWPFPPPGGPTPQTPAQRRDDALKRAPPAPF